MLRTLIDTIKYAKQYPGGVDEKWTVFITLLKLAIRDSFNGNPSKPVCAQIFNQTIFGYDYKALDFLFKEVFIARDYNFKTSNESPTIIDCGSNIGMSVAYFKYQYPKARIIGFEANPDAYALLQKNSEVNQHRDVELHNVALAQEEGHISFFISEYKGTLTGSVLSSRGGEKELQIKAVKLSDYLKDIDHVDLVKMDVEGAELPIILDLQKSGELKKVKELILEYHHNMPGEKESLAEFLSIFESAGFEYSLRTNFFDVGAFQNVLVHLYRK